MIAKFERDCDCVLVWSEKTAIAFFGSSVSFDFWEIYTFYVATQMWFIFLQECKQNLLL